MDHGDHQALLLINHVSGRCGLVWVGDLAGGLAKDKNLVQTADHSVLTGPTGPTVP